MEKIDDKIVIEQGAEGNDIDVVNCWNDTDQSRRGKLNQPISNIMLRLSFWFSFQNIHLGNVSLLLSYGHLAIILDKVCDICRDLDAGVTRGKNLMTERLSEL